MAGHVRVAGVVGHVPSGVLGGHLLRPVLVQRAAGSGQGGCVRARACACALVCAVNKDLPTSQEAQRPDHPSWLVLTQERGLVVGVQPSCTRPGPTDRDLLAACVGEGRTSTREETGWVLRGQRRSQRRRALQPIRHRPEWAGRVPGFPVSGRNSPGAVTLFPVGGPPCTDCLSRWLGGPGHRAHSRLRASGLWLWSSLTPSV